MAIKARARTAAPRCFSLPETALALAIIGICTALALPMLSHLAAGARINTVHRAAQEVASIAASAVAAGDTSIPAAPDSEAAVRLLMSGITITEGLEGMRFAIATMTDKEIESVTRYLRMEGGVLVLVEPDNGP